ncbi:hypothetical protein OSB04_031146 [Centaurea solstitialis]|uniref:Uncharacterized protein n=1 Tax=Centaurea solstitialis TaxID=347529 RepID=A0AA38SGH6_9ASTR|nr:hypothetical protein OSB04_031146 [Centaurea solstitialis]
MLKMRRQKKDTRAGSRRLSKRAKRRRSSTLSARSRKLKGNEKIRMSQNVSAVLQKQLPPKYDDPCMFTISCKVGNVRNYVQKLTNQ